MSEEKLSFRVFQVGDIIRYNKEIMVITKVDDKHLGTYIMGYRMRKATFIEKFKFHFRRLIKK